MEILVRCEKEKFLLEYIKLLCNVDNSQVDFVEKHHSVPRFMGGGDSEIVKLSRRNHLLAHTLLSKCKLKNKKWRASALTSYVMMSGRKWNNKFDPEEYKLYRELHSNKKLSKEHKINIGLALKGKPKSKEHNLKNSLAHKGNKNIMWGKKGDKHPRYEKDVHCLVKNGNKKCKTKYEWKLEIGKHAYSVINGKRESCKGWRKAPTKECLTPSNKFPIAPGLEVTMQQIVEKVK